MNIFRKRANLSWVLYSELAKRENPAERVGRPVRAYDSEGLVLDEILRITSFQERRSILDIGCGCGNLAIKLAEIAQRNNQDLTLLDIEPVINKLESNMSEPLLASSKRIHGIFPTKLDAPLGSYDLIVAYSVMHYVDSPTNFILHACKLLQKGGMIFIGDIPNLDKRIRFNKGNSYSLLSRAGIRQLYSKSVLSDNFSDRKLMKLVRKLRCLGFDAYLYPQHRNLPHSGSREDLVVTFARNTANL